MILLSLLEFVLFVLSTPLSLPLKESLSVVSLGAFSPSL